MMGSDANPDPRKRPLNNAAAKRPLSHSPEPQRPPKLQKSSTVTSPSDSDGLRSSGPDRARRPTHGNTDSPRSPADASMTSGRSTPLATKAAPAANMKAYRANGNTDPRHADPIMEALERSSSFTATKAALHVREQQKNEERKRTEAEYERFRPQYAQYPTLRENKNRARNQKNDELKAIRQEIKNHTISNRGIFEHLASLISQSNEPSVSSTDVVSRAEFDALAKKLEGLTSNDSKVHTRRHDELKIEVVQIGAALKTAQGSISATASESSNALRTANAAADTAANAMGGANNAKKAAKNAESLGTKARDLAEAAAGTSKSTVDVAKDAQIVASKAIQAANDSKNDVGNARKDVSNIRRDVATALQATNELKDWKKDTDKTLEQTKGHQFKIERAIKETKDIRAGLTELQNSASQQPSKIGINDLSTKYDDLKKDLKKEVVSIGTKYEEMAQKVGGVSKTNHKLSKDVEKLQSNPLSQGVGMPVVGMDPAYKKELDDLLKKGDELPATLDEMNRKLDNLTFKVDSEEDSSINKRLANLSREVGSMEEKLTSLSSNLQEVGKRNVIQRLEKHDQLLNNHETKIAGEGSLIQRTTKAEETIQELLLSVDFLKTSLSAIPQTQRSLEEGEILSQQPQQTDNVTREELATATRKTAELEHKLKSILEDLDRLKGAANSWSDASSGLDARVKEIEEHIDPDLEAERDQIVFDEINSLKAEIKQEIENVAKKSEVDLSEHETRVKDVVQKMESLEQAMRPFAPQELFVQSFTQLKDTTVKLIQEEIEKLQGQVKELQKPKQQPQPSIPAPQGLALPPQVPNGVPPSPHISGVARRSATPQGAPAPDVYKLEQRIDGLVSVQQHLKQRCDNLTTDELARQMCDQFAIMYPEAKNFNSAMKAIQGRTSHLEAVTRGMQQSFTNVNQLSNRVSDLQTTCEAQDKVQTQVLGDIVNLKNTTGALGRASKAAAAASSTDTTTRTELDNSCKELEEAMKTELSTVASLAKNADSLSKQHSSRFSKLNPEKRLEELESAVNEHQLAVTRFEDSNADVDESLESLQEMHHILKASMKALEEVFKPKEGT